MKTTPSAPVSYMRGIRLEYGSNTYELISGGEIRMNGLSITPPLGAPSDVIIETTFPNMIVSVYHNINMLSKFYFNISTHTIFEE